MPWFRREKPVGLFAAKNILTRQELRERLKKDRGLIPGTLGKKFSRGERVHLEREVFAWKKFGKEITPDKFNRALVNLRGRIMRHPDPAIKEKLEMRLRYLRKLGK